MEMRLALFLAGAGLGFGARLGLADFESGDRFVYIRPVIVRDARIKVRRGFPEPFFFRVALLLNPLALTRFIGRKFKAAAA